MFSSSPNPLRWRIFSGCRWDRLALARMVEELNWVVELAEAYPVDDKQFIDPRGMAIISCEHDCVASGDFHRLTGKLYQSLIVLFSRPNSDVLRLKSLPNNIAAVITSDMSDVMIQSMLHLVAAGQRILPNKMTYEAVMNGDVDERMIEDAAGEKFDLTERETEVAREICSGKSNKEIARHLGIAVNTVNVHASAVRRKLGVHNRTQIVAHLFRQTAQYTLNA